MAIWHLFLLNNIFFLVDPIQAKLKSHLEETIRTGGKNINVFVDRGKNNRLLGRSTAYADPGDLKNPPGTYPWEVSIGVRRFDANARGNWTHYCGGVIVSKFHVITTANCLEMMVKPYKIKPVDIYVRAGDYHLKLTNDEQHIQEIRLAKPTLHPHYIEVNADDYDYFDDIPEHYNDIAVIEIEQPFNFTEIFVRPVYLPTLEEADQITKDDDTDVSLVVVGWGFWTSENGVKVSNGEQLGDAVIGSFGDLYCASTYNDTRLSKGFTDEVMCGASPLNLAGVCNGDDGSGVVKLDHQKERFVLTGILSLGTDWQTTERICGVKSKPNIFIRVASKNIIRFLYKEIYGIKASYSVEETFKDLSKYEVSLNVNDNCGINTATEGTFNYNDETNKTGVWPWIVSLQKHVQSLQWNHYCAGTILTRTHILTAAHCFDSPLVRSDQVLRIRAGDTRAGDSDLKAADGEEIQDSIVKNRSVHPQYDLIKKTRYHDLAILELETPLNFTGTVRPVCLLSLKEAMQVTKMSETYLPLAVAGWGYKRDKLDDIVATVFSEEKCNQSHPNKIDYKFLVPNLFSEDTMCAGDPAGDSGICRGDSGGGAVHFDHHRQRYVLRAVVSGSAAYSLCGSRYFPNVYVRMANQNIMQWIYNGTNLLSPKPVEGAGTGGGRSFLYSTVTENYIGQKKISKIEDFGECCGKCREYVDRVNNVSTHFFEYNKDNKRCNCFIEKSGLTAKTEERKHKHVGICEQTVDCKLSDWDDWSGCNVTCGDGVDTRLRTVLEEERNGGKPCSEFKTMDVKNCYMEKCPVCSTDSGARCVFPFILEGVEYSGCIPGEKDQHIGMDKHWCSTKVDAAAVHIQGFSAICKPQCPFDTMGYYFGQTGLTEIKAYIKQWGGTDDEVSIELFHGWENASCKTSWLSERQGWDVDNWSNADTELYKTNLGNCQNFKANGTAFAFKMIVSNQGEGFQSLRFWNDELCLDKMEFIVQAQKYSWKAAEDEKENCWKNSQGPIKIATKNNM